jgi:hypothetical protein
MPPMPKGTRYRVKTIIKEGKKIKIRLAFDPKTNKVLEAKKLKRRTK